MAQAYQISAVTSARDAERVYYYARQLADACRYPQYQARALEVQTVGRRMADARDPHFLRALERMAEAIHALAEGQFGETRRTGGLSTDLTELSLVREAYLAVDSPTSDPSKREMASWVYAGLALHLGATGARSEQFPPLDNTNRLNNLAASG